MEGPQILVDNYNKILELKRQKLSELAEIKKAEKMIEDEIKGYLRDNEGDPRVGLRINDSQFLVLKTGAKKVMMNKKDYNGKINEICSNYGLMEHSDFVQEILNAKVLNVVPQEKLSVMKIQ